MRKKYVRVKSHYKKVGKKRVKIKSYLKKPTKKPRKLPRVLIKSKRQTGKRISKNRKVYYEYRKNRTDVKRDKKGWI